MIGTTIAHYKVTSLLGEGGMGAVYRATDTKLGRDVAIKVLPDVFAADPDRLARFTREAQALASLNHPNIASVYGIEERAIIMELVEGPTLEARIHRGPLPLEETVAIARQISEALEAAHEKGIVHRDLKPANVKVTSDGKVKVLDFGLAKLSDPREPGDSPGVAPTVIKGQSPTIAGMILGTAGYMSPEQAAGQDVDRRADIWAFGVVLWEMLSGSALFSGETVTHTIADVMRAEIDVKRLPPGTPGSLRALVRRCLERDMKKRLQAIGEARIALEQYHTEPEPLTPPLAIKARPARWLLAVLPAVALIAGAAMAWLWKPAAPAPLMQFEINLPSGLTLPPLGSQAFVFSPDGERLAFLGRSKDGKTSLWLRNLDANIATPLPGTDGALQPFWSPDGRSIAFSANGRLMKMNASGGPAQVICETELSGGTWSAEGVILIGSAFSARNSPIQRVSASGGTPAPVFPLDKANGETFQVAPFFLPDGKHFFYMSYAPGGPWVTYASLDGKTRKRLFAHRSSPVSFFEEAPGSGSGWILLVLRNQLFAQPFDTRNGELKGERQLLADAVFNGPSWSEAGRGLLAVWHTQNAMNQLMWLTREGALIETVGNAGAVSSPRLSPDGNIVMYQRDREILLYDKRRKITSRFTSDSDGRPKWSPDGSSILYDTARDGVRLTVERPANGTAGERIVHRKDAISAGGVAGFLRGGKWIVINEMTGVYLQSVPDGKIVRLPRSGGAGGASASPDSHWLVYGGAFGGQREVFVQSIPVEAGGSAKAVGRFQISSGGGTQAFWRPDGKEIFYLTPDGTMMAVPVELGVDSFRPGPAKALFQTRTTLTTVPQYDVTPDGQRFLIAQPAEGNNETPITVIMNWTKLLTKSK